MNRSALLESPTRMGESMGAVAQDLFDPFQAQPGVFSSEGIDDFRAGDRWISFVQGRNLNAGGRFVVDGPPHAPVERASHRGGAATVFEQRKDSVAP